jgi:thiamine pyrophosphokinase
MNDVALIANGEIDLSEELISEIKSAQAIIAVDGGLAHCKAYGLMPDFIIGDFDSTPQELLNSFPLVPTKVYPVEKDKTDLELAVELALTLNPSQIRIFGALGGRIDHLLANVYLLSLCPGKIFLESKKQKIFVIDQKIALTPFASQIISLIPLNGPVYGVTTKGLKWELSQATLTQQFASISNVALDTNVSIEVENGNLLCCLNF